tara:strand:+ start:599 stop:2218 length:1620 start_codon:yes stop_codon:yes gene_type:complete
MEELNTPIFAQAKVEYTKQLIDILYPHMFDGIKSIYDESKVVYSSKTGTPILLLFRELLEKVPIWNSEIIDSECSRIINNSKCDWIDDLITAVFISHTKILTSIGPNQSFQKINLMIPKTSNFIHKSYINTARELWKNPYLFNENVPGHEYQRNSREIENIIKNCIENTIRNLLPIKEILKEHLESETDSIVNQKEELKKLLREELKDLKTNITSENKNDEFEKENSISSEIDELDEDNELVNELDKDNELDNDPIIIKESDNLENNDSESNELETKLDNEDQEILEITNKLEEIKNLEENNEREQLSLFPKSDDPTEEQIENNCNDIVVNDITIPVKVEEEIYDNVDVINNDDTDNDNDPERLKRLITNMEVKEEVSVIKSNELQTSNSIEENIKEDVAFNDTKSTFSLNSLYPNMNTNKEEITPIVTKSESEPEPEPEPVPEPEPESKPVEELKIESPTEITSNRDSKAIEIDNVEIKSPRKEVVKLEETNEDLDETSSLANFFQDMKQIAEDKGIKVESNNNNMFTLFEDANETEK